MSDIITPQHIEALWSLRIDDWTSLPERSEFRDSVHLREAREELERAQYSAIERAHPGMRQVVQHVVRCLIRACAASIQASWGSNAHYSYGDDIAVGDHAAHRTLMKFYEGCIRGVSSSGCFGTRCASSLVKYALATAQRLINRLLVNRRRSASYPPAANADADDSTSESVLSRSVYTALDRLYARNQLFHSAADELFAIVRAGGCRALERETGANRGTLRRSALRAGGCIRRVANAESIPLHDVQSWLVDRSQD